MRRITLVVVVVPLLSTPLLRADGPAPNVVFMDPVESTAGNDLPSYQRVTDSERLKQYTAWLDNASARRAFDMYARACTAATTQPADAGGPPPYYVAIVPQGNHADLGFRLIDGNDQHDYPRTAYIKLDPDPRSFGNTLLHETGHILLATLLGGEDLPDRQIASIPHTTSALTDRSTAFNEGFAIHLETLDAHLSDDPETRKQFHHQRYDFGGSSIRTAEFYRPAFDLRTYAQTLARYAEVRDNNYAFATAFNEPDYLRVQLEKSRDFATLRSANQLLQSEGFYASFFFALTMRGDGIPSEETIHARQDAIFAALAEMFRTGSLTADTPFLTKFVQTYMRLYPSEAAEIVDVLLDLSHGVFVDAAAPSLWRDWYLGALRLDIQNLPTEKIETARAAWRKAVLADPHVLESRLGPQLPCSVPSVNVLLVAFGRPAPLAFDLNTAQKGILRLIPGITDEEVGRWLDERERTPFQSVADFKSRVSPSDAVTSALKFDE